MKIRSTNEEIKRLINFIEQGQKRIDDAKVKLVGETDDFEIWRKYGIKNDYRFLLGVDNPIRQFLDKHKPWIYEERYRTIDVEWMLYSLQDLLDIGEITEYEVEEIKSAMMKSNFGSMSIDW